MKRRKRNAWGVAYYKSTGLNFWEDQETHKFSIYPTRYYARKSSGTLDRIIKIRLEEL